MRKILFILNPVAGNSKGATLLPKIKEKFDKIVDIEYKIIVSMGENTIETLVFNELNDDMYTDIVAIGGDGTLMEVINGSKNHIFELKIGLIPIGSGNDFAKTMKISVKIDECIKKIIENKYKDIYLGKINDKLFINAVGIGIDSEVIKYKEESKIKNGRLKYLSSTIKALFKYKAKSIQFNINGIKYQENALLFVVGNGNYFGNGMKILPDASPESQLLSICLVKDMKLFKELKEFPKIYTGKHKFVEGVEFYESKKVQIEFLEDVAVNVDGNIMYMSNIAIEKAYNRVKFII